MNKNAYIHLNLLSMINILKTLASKFYPMEKDISNKLNAFKTSKGNIVWGCALSLAWLDLKNTFHIEKIELETNNPSVLKATKNFNDCPFKPNDIAQRSIYIKTGYGNNTVKIINSQVAKKFPKATIASINFHLNPSDIIAYAYLFKELSFKIKFDLREENNFLFNNVPVKSFYARQQSQKKQVNCYQYLNQDNFIVNIANSDNTEFLFLLKSSKEMDVDEVVQKVIDVQKKGKAAPLRKQDLFQMPCVDLDCGRRLTQFQGLRFVNKQLSEYRIVLILQQLKLHIDQSGAKVQNKGVIIATRGMALKHQTYQPRHILLNKSFWVVMKEPSKYPYICSYIKEAKEMM